MLSDSFQTGLENRKNFRFCLHISDCFRLDGASTEEESAAVSTKEDEELRQTDPERRMEAAADDLERRVGAVMEAAEIAERGMKEAAKEAEVKAASKAANSVSSEGTSPAATSASTAASAFVMAPTSNRSVVSVARSSGYTLIIIML